MTLPLLWSLLARWRWRLALVAALMLLESAALLAVPLAVGQLAGDILTDGASGLTGLAALVLGLLLAISVVRVGVALVSGAVAARLLAELRGQVHDHLLSLPLPFHEDHHQGDLLSLMTYEVGRLSDFVATTLVSLVPLMLTALGAVILMVRIDPVLALWVPLVVPAYYLTLRIVGRRLRGLAQAEQEAEARIMARAEQHLGMLAAIKSFVREDPAKASYAAAVQQARDIDLRQVRIFALLDPALQFIAGAAVLTLLVLAGHRLAIEAMDIAGLVAFLLYAALLTRPVAALAGVYGQFQVLRGVSARLGDVLQTAPEPDIAGAAPMTRAKGHLAFVDVSFRYPGREATLQGITLDIPAGQTLALTGANGAGKTTLVALLSRFRQPGAGRITLDGINVADLPLAHLRGQIGVVPQRALLFNGSVADNIGFGRIDATAEDIEEAARLAQAHAFITALPDGYATEIGDNGVRLSGGQRQRIALARALLKDPPVLVLDEATSMFDRAGEDSFVAEAADVLARRTVIVITHRPATLALADRVVRLEDGRIVEDSGPRTGAR